MAVGHYYIDSIHGDDNNDGRTPATALKTLNGLPKYLGKVVCHLRGTSR